jgi:hypothetical protein
MSSVRATHHSSLSNKHKHVPAPSSSDPPQRMDGRLICNAWESATACGMRGARGLLRVARVSPWP